MKKYMTYITAAVLLASCSDLELLNGEGGDGSALLSVASVETVPQAEITSKALVTGTAFPGGARVGLFLNGTDGYDGKTNGYENVMYHNTVTDATVWSSSSPIQLSDTKGVVYAYYPWSNSITSTTFDVAASVGGSDWMYAEKITDVNNQTTATSGASLGSVSLKMHHALACITLRFKKGTYSGTATLSSFTLSGAGVGKAGKLDITTGKLTGTAKADVTTTAGTATAITSTTLGTTATEYDVLVVPADTVNAQTVTLKCTVGSKESQVSLGSMTLKQGNRYIAEVLVNDNDLTVTSVTLTKWDTTAATGDLLCYPTLGGHEYVEITYLGGNKAKWSTKNMGATTMALSSATARGDGYMFGYTTTAYDATYTSCAGRYDASTMLLLPEYDAAHTLWGGSWQMPTVADIDSLYFACTGSTTSLFGGTYTIPDANKISSNTNITAKGVYEIHNTETAPVTIDHVTYCVNGVLFVTDAKDVTKRVFFPATDNNGTYGCYWTRNVSENAQSRDFVVSLDQASPYYSRIFTTSFYIYAQMLIRPIAKPQLNGHEYVDLGLPSGTLWATCNVGETAPEGMSKFFQWADPVPKKLSECTIANYKYANGTATTYTKYVTDATYGTVDDKTVLEECDDAATVNWGDGWRTPTTAQFQELYANTTVTKNFSLNGVTGVKFTSNIAGYTSNYVFFPYAGYTSEDVPPVHRNIGSRAMFWATETVNHAGYYGSCDDSKIYTWYRYCSMPVRAVTNKYYK